MIEFYPQIKSVHIAAVVISGGLFLLRGLLAHSRYGAWARYAPVRYLSYAVDTVLLTAALMLFTLLPSAVFGNGWLAAKLVLLILYIALGMVALREASPPRRRTRCFVAALAVYGLMVSIARAHHPLGIFVSWLS
ncbi:MAG: SirB2 family protein [Rhodanobacteraceae bacterium]|nr:SirB2 family protein [Rhodanobacteraceae bacterium]